ncbi:hypothetical protein D3C76_1730030 [compost metagenome]
MLGPEQQADSREEVRDCGYPADKADLNTLCFEHLLQPDTNTVGANGETESDRTENPDPRIL